MNWADGDISPHKLRIFWVTFVTYCYTQKSLSLLATQSDRMWLAWSAVQRGSKFSTKAVVPALLTLLIPTQKPAANSSKQEDEKSSCLTTWPFSIAGKLRHLRQMTASKPQRCRGFQAKLGTEF